MRIATAHYHLKPGGVTSVIGSAVRSLGASVAESDPPEVVILSGEAPGVELETPAPASVIEGLGYLEEAPPGLDASVLARRLISGAGSPDLWHIHNPTLGKNILAPDAFSQLAAQGEKLLFQIHDFAEDGRPANHQVLTKCESNPYPPGHYSVLNSRDHAILSHAGLPDKFLHLLPNPVALPQTIAPPPQNRKRLLFYPTRGIRRKNLGELLLLAVLADPETTLIASSAAPANPQWLPIHDHWSNLATELELPAALAVVDQGKSPADFGISNSTSSDFQGWYQAADAVVTTSVAEGFGLAFLEPFAANRPLLGRDLGDITEDFKNEGLQFRDLYASIDVPLEWIGRERYLAQLAAAVSAYYETYGKELPQENLPEYADEEYVDFARLDETMQTQVILYLASNPAAKRHVLINRNMPAGEWLEQAGARSQEIEHNRSAIADRYSLESYGKRLFGIYQNVIDDPARESMIDPAKVLDAFLDPDRFLFLRS